MVAARTTDTLLADVRAAAQLPDAEGRLTTAELYRICDQALALHVADLLTDVQSRRWASEATSSLVAGTSRYRIPARAQGAAVLDVLITDGTATWSAPELPAAEAWRYTRSRGPWDSPYAYTWQDDSIQVLPTPSSGGPSYTLLFVWARQPSRLVAVSDCASIASSTSTTITTSATVPSAWTSAETLDIVRATGDGAPWRNGSSATLDLAGTSISGTSITVSAGLPSDLPAGSYVCLAGSTCVPPVPELAYHVLVQASAMLVLEALGDLQGASSKVAVLEREKALALRWLVPRSKGAAPRKVPYYSPLRIRRGWR